METNLSASIAIKNKNNVWVDDNMVSHCHNCKIEFSFWVRKHHCRNCGNIFCYACSNLYISIPTFITDRPDPADYWNISYYITSLKTEQEKVCKQCYIMINNKMISYEKIIDIFNNPINMDSLKALSDSFSDVKTHYFDHLRNIQYYLPNHEYSEIDKKLLKVNSHYFSKHSKYLVHLIKSIDWSIQKTTKENLEMIINIINSDKNKNCTELYCTRTCQTQLSCDDCINILYSFTNDLPKILLEHLFDIIMNTPEQIILCHLSFFVNLIKNNNFNKLLKKLLFNLLNQTTKIIYHTYWFLNNAKEICNYEESRNIDSFIKLFDEDLVRKMHYEYLFFIGLIKNIDNPKKYLTETFDKCKPISLPYEPKYKLIDVDLDNIVSKTSYTNPTIIPFDITDCIDDCISDCVIHDTKKINLLFKKESIMNDVTVLNLMILCDIILYEHLNKNFGVVIYPAMPLTSNSGVIEMVNNSETIYHINTNKKTILQHIIERNENKIIADVLDRYMYSLVSYTLHSYFIGLGDRHLQNIMITDDGAIFHIDFGFILGTDTYPLTSDIKLNAGMIDVIGGFNGIRYKEYLNLCSKGVTLLRKFFNMFFILLSQDAKFNEKFIEKFVMSRFQPRQKDTVIIEEIISVIKQSNNSYSDYIRDFIHYHSQEKTLQNGVTKVLKSAFGTIKNLSNNGIIFKNTK